MKVRVCVGAVLIRVVDHGHDESALVLLGRRVANREFYPDVWDVLGEFRESLPGGNGSIVLHLYAVPSWNGAPRNLSSEEHSEVSWFAVKDAYRLALAHPSYPEILCRAASISSSAGRTGSAASTIASSGRLENRSVAARRAL